MFAYNAADGTLDLHAKVQGKLKCELEALFARTVLKKELGRWVPGAAYELNGLKDRSLILAPDPEDQLTVQVRATRLSSKNGKGRVTLEPADDDDSHHDTIDRWLNQQRMPLKDVNVTQVTFRFEFLELGDRKSGPVTFNVTYPNTCNLKDSSPERVAVIEKYLRRWKIDVKQSPSRTNQPLENGSSDGDSSRFARAS